MNRIHVFTATAIVFFIAIFSLKAQPGPMPGRMSMPHQANEMYSELYVVPNTSKDSLKITVLLRFPYSAFNFTRDKSGSANFSTIVKGEISIKNSEFIIKNRANFSDTLKAETADETNSGSNFYIKSYTAEVPASDYKIEFELNDANNRQIGRRNFVITEATYKQQLPFVFTYKNSRQEDAPTILDSAFDIRNEEKNIFIPVFSLKGVNTISYEIFKINTERKNGDSRRRIQSGTAVVQQGMEPLVISNNSDYSVKLTQSEIIGTAVVSFKDTLMESGDYLIEYTYDTKKYSENFSVRYINCPASLADIRQAVVATEFLMNEKEFDALKSADGESAQRAIIRKYFSDKDPKPETAFNEAEAEYFRRYDYARNNFYDSQHGNGAETSRGKVYLLYGSPNEISTKLDAEKNLEYWNYSKLKKQIVFSVEDGSIYKIEEINSL